MLLRTQKMKTVHEAAKAKTCLISSEYSSLFEQEIEQ